MKANRTLLQMKYARIIAQFAKESGLSTKESMDFFYHSKEYELIRDGISDFRKTDFSDHKCFFNYIDCDASFGRI